MSLSAASPPWKRAPRALILASWIVTLLIILIAHSSLVTAAAPADAPPSADTKQQTCDVKSSNAAIAQDPSDSDHSSYSVIPAPAPPCCTSVSRAEAKQKHVVFVSIAIKGHALPLLRIASEMKARGYRVSFATHESGKDWAHSYGLPFISAGPFPISAEDLRSKLKAMTRDSSNFRGILTMFNDIYVAAARPMFDTLLPQLAQDPPDLVVMDIATIGAQDLVHKLEIPYIVNSPSIMLNLGGAPSYIPAWGTGYSIHMSLWNRCMNILFPRLLSVALTPPFMQLNKMRWELMLKPYRSQHDVFKGARVILNTAFGLEHPQPMSPLIDAVGPILPIQSSGGSNSSRNGRKQHHQQLGSSLLSWLDASLSKSSSGNGGGVVYLNLGTLAYIDSWQAQALIDGLVMCAEEPPVRVLWILPTDQRNILPSDLPPLLKVKSPSGVSSIDILAHPAVRLVISHCGMVSAQEALVYQKPLLCIPFLVDQPDVAARVVDSGAGLAIDKNVLSPTEVHRAVKELLSNASFARQAARVGRLLKLAGGTNRAIEVIDNGLRLGFDHLETLDLTSPWHKTALLDVWTVYAALFCILAFAIRIHWLLLYFVISEVLSFIGGVLFGPSPSGAAAAQGSSTSSTLTTTADDGNSSTNSNDSATQKDNEASQETTENNS